jgi:hypothetical protein
MEGKWIRVRITKMMFEVAKYVTTGIQRKKTENIRIYDILIRWLKCVA